MNFVFYIISLIFSRNESDHRTRAASSPGDEVIFNPSFQHQSQRAGGSFLFLGEERDGRRLWSG
jgi:hypothetical protein